MAIWAKFPKKKIAVKQEDSVTWELSAESMRQEYRRGYVGEDFEERVEFDYLKRWFMDRAKLDGCLKQVLKRPGLEEDKVEEVSEMGAQQKVKKE